MDPLVASIIAGLIKQFGPILFEELKAAATDGPSRVYTESEIQIAIDRATIRLQKEAAKK
jgi:hypothetical protein